MISYSSHRSDLSCTRRRGLHACCLQSMPHMGIDVLNKVMVALKSLGAHTLKVKTPH